MEAILAVLSQPARDRDNAPQHLAPTTTRHHTVSMTTTAKAASLLLASTLLLTSSCSSSNDEPDVAADTGNSDESSGDAGDTASADDTSDTSDPPVLGPNACRDPGTEAATARCLEPNLPAEYYVAEALAYFDTLDIDADRASVPDYSDLVARWEWPPWLLLTGYERDNMIQTAETLRQFDPSTVPIRDCRFFEEQPFARCFITFVYEEKPCPIYEEFVFDSEGRTTFIEAWSDLPGLLPQSDADRWADAEDYPRLSTRIPGLGSATGRIDLTSEAMLAAAEADEEIADFVRRASDFWGTWFAELEAAPEDFFAVGCGWEE